MRYLSVILLGTFSLVQAEGFRASVDYLLLKADNDLIAALEATGMGGLDLDQREWKERPIEFEWDSGTRVTLGYEFCNAFDITASWMYFQTRNNIHLTGTSVHLDPPDQGFTGSFVRPYYFQIPNSFVAGESSVDARACFNINQFDLDIGKTYCLGDSVTFRSTLGLRGLFIDSNYFTQATFDGANNLIFFDLREFFQNDLCGVGAKVGLESHWCIAYGFHIFGRAKASLIYSNMNIKQRFDLDDVDSGGNESELIYDFKRPYCRLNPLFDFTIGLEWKTTFNCDRAFFAVRCGWEGWYFSDMNQYSRFAVTDNAANFLAPSQSPLSLQGLSAGLEIGF